MEARPQSRPLSRLLRAGWGGGGAEGGGWGGEEEGRKGWGWLVKVLCIENIIHHLVLWNANRYQDIINIIHQ